MNNFETLPGCFQTNIKTIVDIPEVTIAAIAKIKCQENVTVEEWSMVPWQEKGIMPGMKPFFWMRLANGFSKAKSPVTIVDLLTTARLHRTKLK